MLTLKSEVQVKASFRMNVTVVVAAHWFPGSRPRPLRLLLQMKRPAASFLPPRCGVASIFILSLRDTPSAGIFDFPTSLCARFMSWTWRSGGWRRWTPAGRRRDPPVRTATFISLRPSRTAAGRRSSRSAAPRFTATKLWLILEGLCPETSRR